MKKIFSDTISLCPVCAKDSPAFYEERPDGIYFHMKCDGHGKFSEKVESDIEFFKEGYKREYKKRKGHMLIPVTYRCNLNCKHCYSLSNTSPPPRVDRPAERITEIIKDYDGSITFIGGEPTIREDLMTLIRSAKDVMEDRRLSVCTNGYRLREKGYVTELKAAGVDFIYLTVNDIEYEESRSVYENKLEALNNCMKEGMPVYLGRTIDSLSQIDSLDDLIKTYAKVIFGVTLRAARPYGVYENLNNVFVSDMVKCLGKEDDYMAGSMPFYRNIRLRGKKVSLRSWVLDMKRIDPVDHSYMISNDKIMTLRRGIKVDEAILMGNHYE